MDLDTDISMTIHEMAAELQRIAVPVEEEIMPDKAVCICDLEDLKAHGCQCGAIDRYIPTFEREEERKTPIEIELPDNGGD